METYINNSKIEVEDPSRTPLACSARADNVVDTPSVAFSRKFATRSSRVCAERLRAARSMTSSRWREGLGAVVFARTSMGCDKSVNQF